MIKRYLEFWIGGDVNIWRVILPYIFLLIMALPIYLSWSFESAELEGMNPRPVPVYTNPASRPRLNNRVRNLELHKLIILPEQYLLFKDSGGKRFIVVTSEFEEYLENFHLLNVWVNQKKVCHFVYDLEGQHMWGRSDTYQCYMGTDSHTMYMLIPEDWEAYPVPNL